MARPKKSSTITFTTSNANTPVRVFSEELHGKEYAKVADLFEQSNKDSIVSREDS